MKTSPLLIACGILVFQVASVAAPAMNPAAEGTGYSWQQDTNSLALLKGDQVIWRHLHGLDQAKPCFHPISLPGGPELTGFRPPDHPWHRAVWFSWKFINGINYWEEDPKTGQAAGKTEWKITQLITRPDFSARIGLALTYRPAGGRPVFEETRVIAVSAPDKIGVYSMTWIMAFTALTNVILDRTPLPGEPNGQPYGGYAGLSVRFAGDFQEARAITTEGPVAFVAERYRGKAPAMDYSGSIGGHEAGVAILDHPENLNAPTPWYAINGKTMRYFSPALICYRPHQLDKYDPLILRYRLIVHPDRWDPARLRIEHERFVHPPGAPR